MKMLFRNLMLAAVAALGTLALTTASASAQSPAASPAPTNPASVVKPEMVRIPGQTFEAGKYEVTFAEWDACVAGGGCNGYTPADLGWGRDRRPVINVSWNDAQAYVQWLNQKTGLTYRLLTSAEWEIAARAGTTTNFSWGDQDPVCDQAMIHGANFDSCDVKTRPVGSFKPNGYGLFDVHGNVWEWVEDAESNARVIRGGSWSNLPQHLRSANRNFDNPMSRSASTGFRLARTAIVLPEMVRIPGQTFEAGKYEVTFAEWDACVAGGGCNGYTPADLGWGRGRRPVINVSWHNAQAYVQWLNQQTGLAYRLLTWAEWEIAARAGTTTNFWWGDQDPVCDQTLINGANIDACTDDRTRPVGSFKPNGYGLFDVHGNVSELIHDRAQIPVIGGYQAILSGGSWINNPQDLRSDFTESSHDTIGSHFRGFRLARTL